jgi:hypothetical protein
MFPLFPLTSERPTPSSGGLDVKEMYLIGYTVPHSVPD